MHVHPKDTQRIAGTQRLDAFSDGVFAIIVTLLILDVHVPHLADGSPAAVLAGLRSIEPQLFSFAFSFAALCVFWVNHYYFYRQITHIDWPMVWHNCLLLFFLCIVPFTTSFIGAYPTTPFVLSLYSFIMLLAAVSFNWMIRHAFFHSDLTDPAIPMEERRKGAKRGLAGVLCYALGVVLSPISVWITWFMLVFVPLYYFAPRIAESSALLED